MEARPRVWTAFVACGGALLAILMTTSFVFAIVRSIVSEPGAALDANDAAMAFVVTPAGLLVFGSVSPIIFATAALLGAKLSGLGIAARLRLRKSTASWAQLVACVLGASGLSLGAGSLYDAVATKRGGTLESMSTALAQSSGLEMIAAAAVVGVAGPIAEELFFRGYVQTRLAQRWRRWIAVTVSSVIFGAMHMDLVQGGFAFAIGLFLGWITERFGSVRPAIVAHVMNNVGFVVTSALLTGPGSLTRSLAFGVGGLLVFAVSLMVILREREVQLPPDSMLRVGGGSDPNELVNVKRVALVVFVAFVVAVVVMSLSNSSR